MEAAAAGNCMQKTDSGSDRMSARGKRAEESRREQKRVSARAEEGRRDLRDGESMIA